MNAPARVALDTNKLNAALGRFPRDRAMIIDGREARLGEIIERASPPRRRRNPRASRQRPGRTGRDRSCARPRSTRDVRAARDSLTISTFFF